MINNKSPEINGNTYLTTQEAIKYLKISITLWRSLLDEGLPYIKFKRRLLFRKQDIDKFMETKLVRSHEKPKPKGRKRKYTKR